MIILIRRWLKGSGFQVVLWIVLIVLALVFILPDVPRMIRRSGGWIVSVNGQELSSNTFERKKNAFEEISQIRQQLSNYTAEIKIDSKKIAFETFQLMIQEALLDQAVQKLNIQLHPEYVRDKLNDLYFLQFIPDLVPLHAIEFGGINQHALNAHLQRFGLSSGDFSQELSLALERLLLAEMIAVASYVPSFEVKEEIISLYAPKKFSILSFSLDKLYQEEEKKGVSDEELRQFFNRKNATTKQYMVPEKRSGVIWKFTPKDYGIKVSKEDIESYYNMHKGKQFADKPVEVQVRRILFKVDDEAFLPATMEKARNVREELVENPDQFDQKARELSEDSETAKKGGLMPFFSRGTYDKEFEKIAFLLKEDGDISNVIRTEKGVEILQLVARKSQTFKPLSKVEDQIYEKLELLDFKEQFFQDKKQLLEEEENEQAFQKFIAKRGGTAQKVEHVAKDRTKLSQALFRLEKDGISFYIEDSTGVIVKLTSIEKKHTPSLESIKNKVERDLYRERAVKQMRQQLVRVRKQMAAKSVDQIAKEVGASWQKTDWIIKSDTEEIKALHEKGMPVKAMLELEGAGAVTTTEDDMHGYLIRLDEIKQLDDEIIKEKKNEVQVSLTNQQVGRIESGFVASLHRNAIIKTNESLPFSTEDDAV